MEVMTEQESVTYWGNKRVSITGVSGTFGSWLTRWLAESGDYAAALISSTYPQRHLRIG
jgi:nucleoside-diphosphate-sugar epimerase